MKLDGRDDTALSAKSLPAKNLIVGACADVVEFFIVSVFCIEEFKSTSEVAANVLAVISSVLTRR